MKVTLRRGPNVLGVRTGADLDTNDLPPEEAEELRQLLDAAQIEAASRVASAAMPDQRDVTIRVDTPERQLVTTFPEGQTPPEVEPVLNYLDRHAKIIPGK